MSECTSLEVRCKCGETLHFTPNEKNCEGLEIIPICVPMEKAVCLNGAEQTCECCGRTIKIYSPCFPEEILMYAEIK